MRTTTVRPAEVPADWNDEALLSLSDFSRLVCVDVRTVRAWRTRNIGPTFDRVEGTNAFTTVGEVRPLSTERRHHRLRPRASGVAR